MFFYLSKILWFLADPGNLLLIGLCVAAVLCFSGRGERIGRWPRIGRWVMAVTAAFALTLSVLPVGQAMLQPLEDRFPIIRKLPAKVDGVIVLGGVLNELVTSSRGQISIGGGVGRVIELASIANQYPQAKIVFTGGSGKLLTQEIKEADLIGPLFESLGIRPGRVVFENRSRNTFENAVFSRQLVKPKPGETWILITSAFHMPRAVGSFRKSGWPVTAYPAAYLLGADATLGLGFSLGGGLGAVSLGLHEWLGLVFYRLTGKTDAFFPGPN